MEEFFLSPSKCMYQITALLVKEITEGIAGCGVRCGIIGEVGCSSPLYDTERKSLKASVKAQQITGNFFDSVIIIIIII